MSIQISNAVSKRILEKGVSVWYGWYDYPNGARWIAKYRGKYYRIIDDGTSNQFFHSHAPIEITEEEAKRTLLKHNKYDEGIKEFGWKPLTDEEIDELLGLL